MYQFEFDRIYEIFEGESVLTMVSAHFSKEKESWMNLLLEGIRLFYSNPAAPVTSDSMPSATAMSEKALITALRYWTHKDVLRRISYKPAVFRFLDPVPLDTENQLRYNAFAQKIADEFKDYRDPVPYEIQMVYSWKTYPGLQEDVILEVVHQTLEKDVNAGVKSAEPLLALVKWANTREEARKALSEHVSIYTNTREILLRLGQDRAPYDREIENYTSWVMEWGFTQDAILEACKAAARGDPTFEYLNGILRNIHDESHPSASLDAEAVRASFRVAEECKELCKYAGCRFSARYLEEYRQIRAKFDHRLIVLAAKESGKGKRGFNGILKYLVKWEELGLTSVEDVTAYQAELKEQYDLMSELFAQWGLERAPDARDCRLARQWLNAEISREMIFVAAEYAFAAEDPPLYTAKVLRRFQEKGITTRRQAELDHQVYVRERERQRIQEKNEEEIARLRALGPLGPYAGERSPDEYSPQSEEDAFLRMMLALDSMND